MAEVFELIGPGTELLPGGRGLKKTKSSSAFSLAAPVMKAGKGKTTFHLDFQGDEYGFAIGLFPANLKLSSSIGSAADKRCALLCASGRGGCAQILSDGEQGERVDGLEWKTGDTVGVEVTFNGDDAHIAFHVKDMIEERTLKGVPACGLCFGVGLCEVGTGVRLVASSTFEAVR